MDKLLRNKLLLIILVVILAGLGLLAYNKLLGPEGVVGEKRVSIRVVIDGENIDKTFTYQTDHEFVYELLKENEEELGASFEQYSFGVMLSGLMDYKVDQSNNEFFHISVNGEDAKEGIQQIVLNDGDIYTFELKKW